MPDVQVPSGLPCGSDGTQCQVCRHSWRPRKTGPGHPIVIVQCKTHGALFTVYPPGFTPYLRRSLDPKAAGALFGAVADAASGAKAWRRRRGGRQGSCWSTQGRHIARAAILVGLAGVLDGDRVCQDLGVPLHVHRAARSSFRAVPGYRARGSAVVAVLERIEPPALGRLLRAGSQVGLWGQAWRVTTDGTLRRFP